MKKINWEGRPSIKTPISADNLNLMQDNIEENIDELEAMIKGTILYEDENGSRGNITLSESVNDYKRLKIVSIELNNNRQVIAEIDLDVSKRFALNLNTYNGQNYTIFWSFSHYEASDNMLNATTVGYTERNVQSGGMATHLGNNQFKIMKVIGYKF